MTISAVLVLALHAGVLFYLVMRGPSAPDSLDPVVSVRSAVSIATLRTRLLAETAPVAETGAADASAMAANSGRVPPQADDGGRSRNELASPEPLERIEPGPTSTPAENLLAEEEGGHTETPPSVERNRQSGAATSFEDGLLYLPSSLLSPRAQPIDLVPMTYPAVTGEAGRYVAIVSLFIDEQGLVRRIRIEDPGLPLELEVEVRRAFAAARFQPGVYRGRPVRELKRIEVTFE